jgi:YfiH family protein
MAKHHPDSSPGDPGDGGIEVILPDWPAPPHVRAATTTRRGGYSRTPYATLNLADHVGDHPRQVAANRARLRQYLALPGEPAWLRQVHKTGVVEAGEWRETPEGDGSVAREPGVVCAVLTADCLPVLLCDRAGRRVAALHAGWRGLSAGIIEAGVRALDFPSEDLLAWLGPAIGPDAFEVGPEVRQVFVARDARAAKSFKPSPNGRWLADIYQLARLRLSRVGVNAAYGGSYCTYTDAARFYSYRRDRTTGRMANLIWIDT